MKKNNIEKQYLKLLKDILKNGVEKGDRTGTGTISVFGRQIRHDMSQGFPLLTTKETYFKGIVSELIWFLKGETNIKWLLENDNKIWVGDAYKKYKEFAESLEEPDYNYHVEDPNQNRTRIFTKKEFIEKILNDDKFSNRWGELGPIYGKQWRAWERNTTRDEKIVNPGVYTREIDQIHKILHELKTNPDSRRMIVSAWNVGDLSKMTLPPCHNFFQFYTRELNLDERMKIHNPNNDPMGSMVYTHDFFDDYNIPKRAISLMWNQRSVDTFLGLPFNIASYALLLEIIAKEVNMVPDELVGTLGDVHLYKNHIEQAKEQMSRERRELPTLTLDYRDGEYNQNLKEFVVEDFVLSNYNPHPPIKAPLSN